MYPYDFSWSCWFLCVWKYPDYAYEYWVHLCNSVQWCGRIFCPVPVCRNIYLAQWSQNQKIESQKLGYLNSYQWPDLSYLFWKEWDTILLWKGFFGCMTFFIKFNPLCPNGQGSPQPWSCCCNNRMYSRSPIEWGAAGATAAHSQQLSNIIVQHIGGTQTLTHIYPIENRHCKYFSNRYF